jgi:TonB family protein
MRRVMFAAASVAVLGVALAAGAALGDPQPSQAAPSGQATAPVVVHPLPKGWKGPPPDATVNVPMDDSAIGEFASVWPRAAYEARIHGLVMLVCDVDKHGLAEHCDVGAEDPQGKGFGEAALQLRPTFKLKPAHDANGPIDSRMRIAIEFTPPDPQLMEFGGPESSGNVADCGGASKPCADFFMRGNTLNRRNITMVNNPVWVAAPTFDDLMQAYPQKAGGMEGYAVVHCELMRSGALTACQITKEAPESHGFGPAAVSLARKFKVDPTTPAARPRDDLWVDVAVRFPPSGQAPDRSVESPRWVAGFDPDEALAVYPPEAAAKGVASGRGVARCVVAANGALTGCTPEPADPDGLGFSEAVVKLAASMRMNPWTPDASPVDGAVVDVAIRLNLKTP